MGLIVKKITLLLLFIFAGCASGSILPDLNLFKGGEHKGDNAVVKGDIAPIKAPIKAEIQTGLTNTATTSTIGGNVNNDASIMKDYIDALKDTAKQQGRLYQKVIMGLIAQMGILISLLGWCLKFLLKADERRDILMEEKNDSKTDSVAQSVVDKS